MTASMQMMIREQARYSRDSPYSTYGRRNGGRSFSLSHDLMNARMSGLMISGLVVHIPCGRPL
jgi:hypothetical protein